MHIFCSLCRNTNPNTQTPNQPNFPQAELSNVGIIYLILINASSPPYLSNISNVSEIKSPKFSFFLCP